VPSVAFDIDPKQVEITVTNDAITLKGETKHEEEHKDGVLEVKVPKSERAKATSVQVKVEQ